jgi:ribosomal protein RSM22 (predicted rRNA methylase)
MNGTTLDFPALERLRRAFLEGTAGAADYWESESDLASYDATFAQRIGWKWDYVLSEIRQRGWTPQPGDLVDWGCGSGIAHRAFLDHFGTGLTSRLWLADRSPLAVNYAIRRATTKFPALRVEAASADALKSVGAGANVLISHLITELPPARLEEIIEGISAAQSLIWVEPGTYEASRMLIGVRERLLGTFRVVAPCTHEGPCGLLADANHRHWCHHFADPPPGVFIDGEWARFANLAGIDLRSLPLSFLVLDRRPPPALPSGAGRILGKPRVYKAHALLLGCDESGVRERRLVRRDHPDAFRAAKKETLSPLQTWEEKDGHLTRIEALQ